ncbi:hypothetical protein KC887_09865 [Candidatus Kaiserbacteria bacterium]|nr:hypothetical protein [Candidatus Kaiserbacteria bacterium]
MSNAPDIIADIETLPPPSLELLERQIISTLYAIWKAQGKDKEIVDWSKRREIEQRRLTRSSGL